MKLALLALLAVMTPSLSACLTIASISTDGGKPKLRAYPGLLVIARDKAEAVDVDAAALGLMLAPDGLSLGFEHLHEIRVDEQTCGVAVVENPSPQTRELLGEVADRVRGHCLHVKPPTPPDPTDHPIRTQRNP